MSKKIISLLLVIAMIAAVMSVSIISSSARTQDAAATGDGETYYLVGKMQGIQKWETTDYPLIADGDGYVIKNVPLKQSDEIKVKGSDNSWYPDGGNYWITDDGVYDIRLSLTDNNITVSKATDTITVYMTQPTEWSNVKVHYWCNTGIGTEWNGLQMTYAYTNSYQQSVFKAEISSDVKGLIFNDGSGNQTANIEDGIRDGMLWYYDNNTLNSIDTTPCMKGYTIGLRDNIAVNFYAYIEDGIYGGFQGTFSYGSVVDQPVTAYATNDYGASFVFTCMVPAKSMTDDVTLTVKLGDTVLFSDTQSVADYAVTLANMDYYKNNNTLKSLLCDMLDYGASVQTKFDYNTDALASGKIADIGYTGDRRVAPATIAVDPADMTISTYGNFKGASLNATSQTAINLFFGSDFTASVGYGTETLTSKEATIGDAAGKYKYVTIGGISAKDIFTTKTVTIGNVSYTYNAANYYNAVVGGSYAPAFQNVMKAMYNYSAGAAAYAASLTNA